jgi:hypothetical protein
MLANNTKYDAVLARLQAAAQAAGKPWRMCETASFSGGGKQGVSDTFAAALWALDYLFVLAEHGCAGVNMETGVNHIGWISHYTPISDDLKGHYGKAPEYYGLNAFAFMAGGEVVAVDCQAGGINIVAHAVRKGREICVALINKDLNHDAEVFVTAGGPVHVTRRMQLTAPSAETNAGIELERVKGMDAPARDTAARLGIGPASAVMLWLEV